MLTRLEIRIFAPVRYGQAAGWAPFGSGSEHALSKLSQINSICRNLLPHGLGADWRGKHDTDTPRPITQGIVAKLLTPFGIRPAPVWPLRRGADTRSSRGYYRHQFEDAWRRYCPSEDDAPTHSRNVKCLRQISRNVISTIYASATPRRTRADRVRGELIDCPSGAGRYGAELLTPPLRAREVGHAVRRGCAPGYLIRARHHLPAALRQQSDQHGQQHLQRLALRGHLAR